MAVCILYDLDLLCGHFADDTDSKSGTREWLTEYQMLSGIPSSSPALRTSSLNRSRRGSMISLKSTIIRKAAYVVVGFDHCGFSAQTALYHVRINGSLYQEIHGTDLLRLFLEYTDELFTDDLTFCFRLCNTCQLVVVSLLCIHTDKVQVKLTVRSEYAFYLIAFILYGEGRDLQIHRSSCLPIALESSPAATEESTPPDSAQKYFAIADFLADLP